jgi:hypothetical protein
VAAAVPAAAVQSAAVQTPAVQSAAVQSAAVQADASGPPQSRGVVEHAGETDRASAHVLLVDELPYSTVPNWVEAAEGSPPETRGGRPYHPDPRVIVDVRSATADGALIAELQRIARNLGYWPFRRCYEEGLRRNPTLMGKVSVELNISATGRVKRATATSSSTLSDLVVAACVAREAQKLPLAYSDPSGSDSVSVVADVSLAVGDKPVLIRASVVGAEALRESLRVHLSKVEQCYASRAIANPRLGGRMQLRFHVGASGEVLDVHEEGGPFEDAEVVKCVLAVFIGVTLAAHKPAGVCKRSAGSCAEPSFVYALHFESSP